jgi:hypothetical protein
MRGGLFIEVREYIALSAHSDEWVPAALGGIWCSVEKLQMQCFRNRQDAQARSIRDEPCRETSLTRFGEQACLGRGSACPLSNKNQEDAGIHSKERKVSRGSGVLAAIVSRFESRIRARSDGL